MVKALGHEARLILDFTDHVWTEVFIEEDKQWVNMDSCENSYNAPLLYEKGWGKKLNYCIAVSPVEIVDVTPRYTLNYAETSKRRLMVNEKWLAIQLRNLNESMKESLSTNEKEVLILR